ncbi:MAG TPA: transglutaminase-like domain-containing protein [Pyrinomonadaceae bacterium]
MRSERDKLKNLFLAVVCAACVLGYASGQESSALTRPLKFTSEEVKLPFTFQRSTRDDAYMTRLRQLYALDGVVAGKKSDYEKVRALSMWVRKRWEHNGSNEPQKPDPISILQEAAAGKSFRCVEYSVVLSAALNAVGIPARVLGLKTEDVETRESGAGHVVTEAYLADKKKWIMVDGQWDVIPTLKGRPLHAVELQEALATRASGLGVESLSGAKADKYFQWVAPYLFYFDTRFDSRIEGAAHTRSLMLVPVGAKEPSVFQKKHSLKSMVYTNSTRVFYAPPA